MSYDSNIRLAQFLKHENIKGTEFAEMIGTSQPTISAILSSKRALSRGMMARTCDVFHQLNFTWLLTGEGDMLKKDPESLQYASLDNSNVMIPLIHIDSVGGVHSENSITSSEQYVERLIPFPDARPGDVAILQSGNSMAPTIPAGAILQIRKVEGWQEYFGYGNDFVLWLTDDRRITKQVLKYTPNPQNFVTCHSYNPESADEELPKSMIKEVWKVVNVLINKGW